MYGKNVMSICILVIIDINSEVFIIGRLFFYNYLRYVFSENIIEDIFFFYDLLLNERMIF